ncbi:MAG TPA: glycosyltransferase family 39 protein [Pseudolabrys sp.]|nr:glycosyltransferase family 39 protein [Pseudolabrys sp.]
MLPSLWARARLRVAAYDRYDLAVAALLATLVVLVFATYDSYAISNDEEVQQHYGELIVAYYSSGFTNQSLFHFVNLYLYGGLFDIVAVAIERALPMIEPYTIRHLISALTGIGGIAAAWATARLVAGPRAGAIAAFALAVCGAWYGSMFNHTKDIPFAAAMMAAVYFLLRAARNLPHPRWRDVLGFGLMLGAALGIRVLGLLLIGYAGLAILIHMPALGAASVDAPSGRAGPMHERLRFFAQSVIALCPAFFIGYVIMIVAWPWAALSPLNPVRGLIDFGEFHYHIRTLLDGQVYEMANVPRWYVPAYLLIKLPLLIVAGVAIALMAVARPGASLPPDRRAEALLLSVIATFPVICEVIDRGPAFTGLRHFLFVVPVLAVLTGIGFDWLLTVLSARRALVAQALGTAVALALLWNAGVLIMLHPYQYLFYNPLVGGLEGASGRYATDYWVNIMPEAVDDLEAFVAKLDEAGKIGRRYFVAVCGERLPFEKEANSRLQWTEDWKKADFFIAPTHMNCDRVLDGKVISTIARLGVKIGVVKDRRSLVQKTVAGAQ